MVKPMMKRALMRLRYLMLSRGGLIIADIADLRSLDICSQVIQFAQDSIQDICLMTQCLPVISSAKY